LRDKSTPVASPEVAAKEGWFDLLLPLGILLAFYVFIQWQKTNVENPSEWVSESRSLLRTGQYQKSLEFTLKLNHTFPKNHVYFDQAAVLYNHLGDFKNEAAMLEKFLLTAADPGEACPRLPKAYRASNDKTAMLDAAKRCLALEPKNSDFQFEMALSYERTGDAKNALSIYEQGEKNYPGYIDFSIGVARILFYDDKVEQSWHKIEPILKARPHLADAQIVAVKALLALNKKEQAQDILNQAIDDHPNYEELRELKERFK
jgi:tetratricopeptide (TPR) repeat protein